MFSAAADIFISNILPVFLILAVGYLLAVRFTLDIYTLTKINFYGVTPASSSHPSIQQTSLRA